MAIGYPMAIGQSATNSHRSNGHLANWLDLWPLAKWPIELIQFNWPGGETDLEG